MTRTSLLAVLTIVGLALGAASRAHGQLAAPGASGVAMGHIHLAVRDVDVQKQFWTMLGATPVQNGQIQLMQFPARS